MKNFASNYYVITSTHTKRRQLNNPATNSNAADLHIIGNTIRPNTEVTTTLELNFHATLGVFLTFFYIEIEYLLCTRFQLY